MRACTIVTGAASGIGLACVDALLARGDTVYAVDRTPVPRNHARLATLKIDITNNNAPEKICLHAQQVGNGIAGFVHAAGINRLCHPFDVDESHWDAVMNVNAKATWFLTVAVLKQMLSQHAGSVVLLASIAGKMASTIQHPVYNVSKAAVIAMTKTFAQTVANSGVRVNCVCPGIIDTPMQQHVTAHLTDDAESSVHVLQQRLAKVPLARMGSAAEVAQVVMFLLGAESSYIHGQALNIDGGLISY